MPKKKLKTVASLIEDQQAEIQSAEAASGKNYIPSIIEFCESPLYLALPKRGINLFPMQKIILKVFYRGSKGNEDLQLTEEEIDLLKDLDLVDGDRGDVLGKYLSCHQFRELILVWGRRSGKDFMSSIVATYEAMRLLEAPDGDPYKIYNLAPSTPISILTVATGARQAGIAFQEMKDKILQGPYFADKIHPDGVESESIYLLTPKDKEENMSMREKKFPIKKGSVVIEVGHSNSDGLLGKGVFVLILDEVASYKTTGGSSGGERTYTALTPALSTYGRDDPLKDKNGDPLLDEDGNQKTRRVYDSKIICISSPRGEEGLFWRLFKETEGVGDRLSCRLPTWEVKTSETVESLKRAHPGMSEEQFWMEIGAQFSGTAGDNFFPQDNVKECFELGSRLELDGSPMGKPGQIYFAHLDPAETSHNYALVVLHREHVVDYETKEHISFIIVDHIKVWRPSDGKPIKVQEVDEYVVKLKRKFNLAMVTYDQWNSENSIKTLRKHGIPSKCTRFSQKYKMQIYTELYNLVVSGRLALPGNELLKQEMVSLQRKFTPNGYRVLPRKDGECNTDDIVDALAAACFNSVTAQAHRLPRGTTVSTGVSPQGNQRLWQSMQGTPLGFGTGQQVANALEKRGPHPYRKR